MLEKSGSYLKYSMVFGNANSANKVRVLIVFMAKSKTFDSQSHCTPLGIDIDISVYIYK